MVQDGLSTSQYYHHLSCQPGEGDVTGVVLIMTFHYHLIQYYHHLTFTPEEECVLGVVLPTSHSLSPGVCTRRSACSVVLLLSCLPSAFLLLSTDMQVWLLLLAALVVWGDCATGMYSEDMARSCENI